MRPFMLRSLAEQNFLISRQSTASERVQCGSICWVPPPCKQHHTACYRTDRPLCAYTAQLSEIASRGTTDRSFETAPDNGGHRSRYSLTT